jgi:type II secretion system protein N
MRWALYALGGAAWLAVVFLVAFRLTFPSDAFVDRARVAVDEASGGSARLDVERVKPAWVGLRGRNVVLSSVADGVATPTLAVEDVKVTTSLLSLITGSPTVGGFARFGEGRLDFDAALAADEDGRYGVADLVLEAGGFPIGALPPIQGTQLVGTGALDLDLDLMAPEGFKSADGRARLSGRAIQITELSGGMGAIAAGFGIVPVTIDELDLDLEIVAGKAMVSRGILDSTLALVTITGDIVLQDAIGASRLRLDLVIEGRDGLAQVESALRSARWSDGKYHYELRGSLRAPRFQPARERRASTRRAAAQEADGEGTEELPPPPAILSERPKPDRDPSVREATLERARAAREARAGGGPMGLRPPGDAIVSPNRLQGRDERDADTERAEEGGDDTGEPPSRE